MEQTNLTYRYPVSVKGVVQSGGRFLLLKNERDEWELPGGKLEPGETPEACVVREIKEEVGVDVRIGPILDTWVYEVFKGVYVFIVTYGCYSPPLSEVCHSPEHKEANLFNLDGVEGLNMPEGYRQSIRTWSRMNSE